jgi:hypothetical protein
LRDSRDRDIKTKTHLAESVMTTLEEIVSENDQLVYAIMRLTEESKVMEHRHTMLEAEVVQLRLKKARFGAPSTHCDLVGAAVSSEMMDSRYQREMTKNREKRETDLKKESKELIDQANRQKKQLKDVKAYIVKSLKATANLSEAHQKIYPMSLKSRNLLMGYPVPDTS